MNVGFEEELEKIINSKESQDAERRIEEWKKRLSDADKEEVIKVRDEKKEFFTQMRENNPTLYEILRIEDKGLSEIIHEKLTGQHIIID